MTESHPNIALMMKLNMRDLDASAALISEDFVWHYFNPKLPEVQGDYIGLEGLKEFFGKIAQKTNGTFKIEPVSVTPVGDELVVAHVRDTMEIDDNSIAIDVVVVWRIVEGQFAEAWDIPSAFAMAASPGVNAPQA